MAFTHGKDSVFKLDNASGSLTDISTYVNNVDFPETADVSETTTLGADNKTYIAGLRIKRTPNQTKEQRLEFCLA